MLYVVGLDDVFNHIAPESAAYCTLVLSLKVWVLWLKTRLPPRGQFVLYIAFVPPRACHCNSAVPITLVEGIRPKTTLEAVLTALLQPAVMLLDSGRALVPLPAL